MLLFDGDYPMAHGALTLQRDLTRPLAELQAAERAAGAAAIATATLPAMRQAQVTAALVKVVGRIQRPGSPLPGYASAHCAYAAARGDLAYYQALRRDGEVTFLTTASELDVHIAQWQAAGGATNGLPVGLVLGMEGADPIIAPPQLDDWWADGLRVVSLTHYGVSTYAHGTGTPGGLRPQAADLLRRMQARGMLLDLTHLADDSFWEAVKIYDGPVLASHQNCRALCPGERQFDDNQLQLIIERDGVVGVAMDSWMLFAGADFDWRMAGKTPRRSVFPREAVTLDHLADHIDHICQLAGNADHVAIGGDTDGQGGIDGTPYEVVSISDYHKLQPLLAARGFTNADIAGIFCGNWQRFFATHLPA
jgi:membrane dipeptidase